MPTPPEQEPKIPAPQEQEPPSGSSSGSSGPPVLAVAVAAEAVARRARFPRVVFQGSSELRSIESAAAPGPCGGRQVEYVGVDHSAFRCGSGLQPCEL